MSVAIELRFLAGRFHSTRWRQNAFEDRYGEWPPSPWRLLRALAARWFQYTRETGDEDREKRHRLLSKLAASLPEYRLPPLAWRGPSLKQYQPVGIGWSDPAAKAAAVREPSKTLVADTFWCVPAGASVVWSWPDLELAGDERQLLSALVARVQYFGRAESASEMRLLSDTPPEPNCRLGAGPAADRPVLAFIPGSEFREDVLLSATDSPELRNSACPPGTGWFYAELPRRPAGRPLPRSRSHPSARVVQFAVGGRVYPELHDWVRLTARLRGRVLRHLTERAAPEACTRFAGRGSDGAPLAGHTHPYFCLWPDDHGYPTRLVVWKGKGDLDSEEVGALIKASEWTFSEGGRWEVRLVPLPSDTPPPAGFESGSRVWESVTPFVPPAQRFHFRKNGRERPGESAERLLAKLAVAAGYPEPSLVELIGDPIWVALHHTQERREQFAKTRTPFVRPGRYLRVTFPESIRGPLALGDSCHFGLGLFRAVP